MLTVRLHGVLVRLAGTDRLVLELAGAQPVAAVLEQIAGRWPQLGGELKRTACAVGDRLVPRTERVTAGAELNLLPPVSGG